VLEHADGQVDDAPRLARTYVHDCHDRDPGGTTDGYSVTFAEGGVGGVDGGYVGVGTVATGAVGTAGTVTTIGAIPRRETGSLRGVHLVRDACGEDEREADRYHAPDPLEPDDLLRWDGVDFLGHVDLLDVTRLGRVEVAVDGRRRLGSVRGGRQ